MAQIPIVEDRASSRASATAGSANAPTSSTGQFFNNLTQDLLGIGNTVSHDFSRLFTSVNEHRMNWPPPIYRPYNNGQELTPGQTMSVGYIESLYGVDAMTGNTPNPYRFVFHYNPSAIDINAQLDQSAASVILQPPDSTGIDTLTVTGAVSVSFLIDRSIEVRTAAKSTAPGPGNTKDFSKMGTLYDLEFFHRVFNGKPRANNYRAPLANSSMYGFVAPTPAYMYLGPAMIFRVRPVSVDINHFYYTPNMIPLVTEVKVAFANVLAGANRVLDANTSKKNGGGRRKKDKTTAAQGKFGAAGQAPTVGGRFGSGGRLRP